METMTRISGPTSPLTLIGRGYVAASGAWMPASSAAPASFRHTAKDTNVWPLSPPDGSPG